MQTDHGLYRNQQARHPTQHTQFGSGSPPPPARRGQFSSIAQAGSHQGSIYDRTDYSGTCGRPAAARLRLHHPATDQPLSTPWWVCVPLVAWQPTASSQARAVEQFHTNRQPSRLRLPQDRLFGHMWQAGSRQAPPPPSSHWPATQQPLVGLCTAMAQERGSTGRPVQHAVQVRQAWAAWQMSAICMATCVKMQRVADGVASRWASRGSAPDGPRRAPSSCRSGDELLTLNVCVRVDEFSSVTPVLPIMALKAGTGGEERGLSEICRRPAGGLGWRPACGASARRFELQAYSCALGIDARAGWQRSLRRLEARAAAALAATAAAVLAHKQAAANPEASPVAREALPV
jgi:hypothetical protein